MEPSGGNQWQSVANATAAKTQNQAKSVAVGCDPLPLNLDGKEGVDGSSPSEGPKIPAKRGFLLSDLVHESTSLARRGSAVSDDNRGLRERRDQAVREPDLLEQPGLGTGFRDGFGRRAASQGNAIANALDSLPRRPMTVRMYFACRAR
jgi:hypothetical protein